MLFTFRRDDDGRERIYVGDVCVAEVETIQQDATVTIRNTRMVMHGQGVNYPQICQAIERADAAGFWKTEDVSTESGWGYLRFYIDGVSEGDES